MTFWDFAHQHYIVTLIALYFSYLLIERVVVDGMKFIQNLYIIRKGKK